MKTPHSAILKSSWNESTRDVARSIEGPILIIGASGFIGAKLLLNLQDLRDDVHGASSAIHRSWRLTTYRADHLHVCDITDRDQIRALLAQIRPRTVFNFAAYGGYSWQTETDRIYQVNFTGTLNLVSELSQQPGVRLIHAGSSSEYGTNSDAPTESAVCQPNSDYALSKLHASRLVEMYARRGFISAVTLRLYSVYGPLEERGRLIPAVMEAGIFGKLPPFAAKHFNRDFVYVDEATRAFVLAAQSTRHLQPGEIFNIASGVSTTLSEIAELSRSIFKLDTQPTFDVFSGRSWEVDRWRGYTDTAKNKIGWENLIDLRSGLELTKQWELERRSSGDFARHTSQKRTSKKISVVVACHRDEEAIPLLHERLSKIFDAQNEIEGEFIFVNDGSPQRDEQKILECSQKDPRILGISHSRNFGSQSAFLSGIQEATGNAVVLMDGDLQDPPELIPQLIEKWREGADIVIATRSARAGQPFLNFCSKLFYRMYSKLIDFKIPYDAGDFSLIDRKVVEELGRFNETDLFLRSLRAWTGFRQNSVTYERPKRFFGKSTNSWLGLIGWARRAIFNFSLRPVAVIYFMSTVSLVASPFLWSKENWLGVQALTAGAILLSVAWVGEYAGRGLFEAKKRPRFIRSRLIQGGRILPPASHR